MFDTYLVPENTTVTVKGDGETIDLSGAAERVFLLVLRISETVEQEALDVMIFGSADGTAWEPKPLLSFPQKFYRSETPILLDVVDRADVRFVRAHWEVNRWGRGPEEPRFVFDLRMREVPGEILAEAREKAREA
ncbi:MAG: hypothetical protein ROO76_22355 [Terriglobia bacterium]|jgi:hypothetical protein|nr:hypothetical protein [Terriglobia bacterium]